MSNLRNSDWEQRARKAALSWNPEKGGKRSFVCFEDDKTYDLGDDLNNERFLAISNRMLNGKYYPADAVAFSGDYLVEKRELIVGDRVFQHAPMFLFWGGPSLRSAVEIFCVRKTDSECEIGYVTTEMHHGRGIWNAVLTSKNSRLSLRVKSTALPNSALFWLGLPIARTLQLRARRRAVKEFLKL